MRLYYKLPFLLFFLYSCKTTNKASEDVTRYLFQTEITPNTIFKTSIEQNMEMNMTMSGHGMPTYPTVVKTKTTGGTTLIIGNKNQLGYNPVSITYDSLNVVAENELPVSSGQSTPDFSKAKLHGHYDGKTIRVDSVTGVNDQLSNMIQQLSQPIFDDMIINFPSNPMSIGESFTDFKTLDLPLQGLGIGVMDMKLTYTLVKVMNQKATFNNTLVINGSININGEESLIVGEGSGYSILDITEKYISFSNLTLTQTTNMKMQGVNIRQEIVIHSKNKVAKCRPDKS